MVVIRIAHTGSNKMKPTNTMWIVMFILSTVIGMSWAASDFKAGRCLGCVSMNHSSSRE